MHRSASIDEYFGEGPSGLTGMFATFQRMRRAHLASRNRLLTSAFCAGNLPVRFDGFIAMLALLRRHKCAAVFSEK